MANFPQPDADIAEKTKYSDWHFVPKIKVAPAGGPPVSLPGEKSSSQSLINEPFLQ
jgi:hypothetical protein